MNLINKDFVTPTERLGEVLPIKIESPLSLAKVYLSAQKEVINNLGINPYYVPAEELHSRTITVLCEWASYKI
jgi:hypothetical protein